MPQDKLSEIALLQEYLDSEKFEEYRQFSEMYWDTTPDGFQSGETDPVGDILRQAHLEEWDDQICQEYQKVRARIRELWSTHQC